MSVTLAMAHANAGIRPCPVEQLPYQEASSASEQLAQVHQLETFAELCEANAEFHGRLGSLLLQLGFTKEAVTALEKALLISPDLAGVQIDYALALAALGQRTAALDVVSQVSARSDTPHELKKWLEREVALVAKSESPRRTPTASQQTDEASKLQLSGFVQPSVGGETNLSNATHIKELTLFLVNGPVIVPLDDRKAPAGGLAYRLTSSWQINKQLDHDELKLTGVLQTRQGADRSLPLQQYSRFEASWGRRLDLGQIFTGLRYQNLQQRDQYAAQDLSMSATYIHNMPISECKPLFGLVLTDQTYPLVRNMDGRLSTIRTELICPYNGQLHLGSSLGVDRPSADERPGGSRRKWDLYFRHLSHLNLMTLHSSLQTTAWMRVSRTEESELFNNLLTKEPVQTRRLDAGIAVYWPIHLDWDVGAEFETSSQQSSNLLLNLRNSSLYLLLRWKFRQLIL